MAPHQGGEVPGQPHSRGDDESLEIRPLAPSDLDSLAPLWQALLDHIAGLPGAVVPVRPFEQSWPLERATIARILDEDGFGFLALRAGRPVGYALVSVEDADPVWYTGEKYAELVHLSVTEEERANGVGTALLDAVDAELTRRGIEDVQIGVDAANHGARRFYERRGYRCDFLYYYGTPGRRPWACLRRDAEDRDAGRGRYAPGAPDRVGREQPPGWVAAGPGTWPGGAGGRARRYVSVIGASQATPGLEREAEEVGRLLAGLGCVVVCGGKEGVMAAVARGVAAAGGVSIGILPDADRRHAAPDLTFSLCTAIGHARNLCVVASGDVVLAVGGSWGTLSEIALARTLGREVVLLHTWEVTPPGGGPPAGVHRAASAGEAAELVKALLED